MQKKLKHKLMLPGFALILSTSFLSPSVLRLKIQISHLNQIQLKQMIQIRTTMIKIMLNHQLMIKRIHLNLLILIKVTQINLTKIKLILIIVVIHLMVVKMTPQIRDKMMVQIQMITLIQTMVLLIIMISLVIKIIMIILIIIKINQMMTKMMDQIVIKIQTQIKIIQVLSQMTSQMIKMMVLIPIKMDKPIQVNQGLTKMVKTNPMDLTIKTNQILIKTMINQARNQVQDKLIINIKNQAISNHL